MTRVARALLIAAGVAVTVAGAAAMRWSDWPIYLTYVALALLLNFFVVEVQPGLGVLMPGLALSIGFVYIGGLPVATLRNVALPALLQVLRIVLPERWWQRLPARRWPAGTSLERLVPVGDRATVAAYWSVFAVGMGARWAAASFVAGRARPVEDLGAIAVGEIAGYACWTAFSALPIFSFPPVPVVGAALRPVEQDLGIMMILVLTPFVFLIAYGYREHGLVGAAVWSCAALGLHVVLQRLNERRLRVAEQARKLEEMSRELAHRERLSAIGKTSSVLSHQILQQLGVIGIHADLVRTAAPDDDPAAALARAREHAAAIERALADVDHVLRDVLVFSRDLRVNLYAHDVGALVAECADACRAFAEDHGVVLHADGAAAGTAMLDKLKLRQALVNVVRNAVEASPHGGEVTLEAAGDGDEVRVVVADRGAGIPDDARERVFAPFYTTKEGGTGLGLAIARELVVAHGGRIDVGPRAGGGTVVDIRLPRRPPDRRA